jgi:acyl-CoA thioesterase
MAQDFETFKRHFDADPFHAMLGISVLEQRRGYARIQLEVGPDTPGGIGGSVHGGVLATLVDVCMLVAIFGGFRPDQMPAGTADLGITYMRQAHGERLEAEAKVVKHGRQLAVVEVDITDDTGELCARGRVLYAFRPVS